MSKDTEEPRFHIPQPQRDPESNWAVDLAKNLEEYLVKICSGEVSGDDAGHLSINFAEAALLLQSSAQVYSRKVEYLYSLVLHALEFLSNKRQDQTEKTSDQTEGSCSNAVVHDENEPFLDLDDIPVDAKNCLEDGHSKDDTSDLFVKPPANLVVLEGDCFDSIGDVGELESYLLATHDLYRDFILLDPSDTGAVDTYFENEKAYRGNNVPQRGSSLRSKTRKSFFLTPTRQSDRTAHKSPLEKTPLDENLTKSTRSNHDFGFSDNNIWPDGECNFPETDHQEDGINDDCPEPMDESDSEDDPWKPLNPHEPGNLKVKPFQKARNLKNQKTRSTKLMSLASQFPVARLHGVINPEYKDIWEAQLNKMERPADSQPPPLYEKLRQSLETGGNEPFTDFTNPGEDNEANDDDNDIPDFGEVDFTMPESTFMAAEEPQNQEMHDGDVHCGSAGDIEPEDSQCNVSLEDLCRSHLDALLASIAETEKQTELAARVSTWKQRIESTLDEQDSRTPFDIHEYGERVLNKLYFEGENGSGMSFTNVVRGQEKHDVARTFSALLQLVNNRSVDLDKLESTSQSVCYTAENPFHVRLLTLDKRPGDGISRLKRRGKSPVVSIVSKAPRTRSPHRFERIGSIRCLLVEKEDESRSADSTDPQ